MSEGWRASFSARSSSSEGALGSSVVDVGERGSLGGSPPLLLRRDEVSASASASAAGAILVSGYSSSNRAMTR